MNLIQKDNQYYAECDVVMIETDKTEEVGDIVINEHCENEMGIVTKNNVYTPNVFRFDYTGITFRNYKDTALKPIFIYILSSEEIKVGDYISDGYKVWKWNDDSSLLGRKKVIASTDISLTIGSFEYTENCIHKDEKEFIQKTLPKIPNEFIQQLLDAFNSVKPISKCLVEVYTTHETSGSKFLNYKIKEDNTIVIEKSEETLYTKEDMNNFAEWYIRNTGQYDDDSLALKKGLYLKQYEQSKNGKNG